MHEWDGTFELVPIEEIHFDRKYQREQHWPLIAKIAGDPIWSAFGVVVCAKREYAGGLFYALDGQQRLHGVLTAEAPATKVPVVWWPVKTVAEEATLFDRINTARKQVASLQVFKARLAAENLTYVRIAAAVERAGYTIGSNAGDPNTIGSVRALERIYNTVGEEAVEIGLRSYREAWPDEDAPTYSILVGLCDVMSEMDANGGLTVERLARGCSKTTPGRLMRKAEDIKFKQGGSKREAVRKAFKTLAKV